jgi:hypothetical protein
VKVCGLVLMKMIEGNLSGHITELKMETMDKIKRQHQKKRKERALETLRVLEHKGTISAYGRHNDTTLQK